MTVQISHLNSGTGYPWDWHNKTIEFIELFLIRVPSKSEDNVGDLNPTGSKFKFKIGFINRLKFKISLKSECWR